MALDGATLTARSTTIHDVPCAVYVRKSTAYLDETDVSCVENTGVLATHASDIYMTLCLIEKAGQ